jgi:hypothetical protein
MTQLIELSLSFVLITYTQGVFLQLPSRSEVTASIKYVLTVLYYE